ncbi:MAG: DNA polymerase III subunit beta [Chthoniobacterales bacterium]|nr:DNA polymerase III subunit beta [Chthoniobacterales bacterium]
MKAQVLQEDFSRGLGVVARVIPNKGQLPAVSCALIELGEGGVEIIGTNLEQTTKVACGGKVLEKGAIAVPARSLVEFLNSGVSGILELETQGAILKLSGEGFSVEFAGIGAAEYPMVARYDGGEALKLDKEMFVDLAQSVAFAAASDEARPILMGIKFEFREGKLLVSATDGFRLSRRVFLAEGAGELGGVVVPARSVIELGKLLAETKKGQFKAQVKKDLNQLLFVMDKFELGTRVLDGSFPDVERVIPKEAQTKILVDRESLLRAIKAIGVFARENNNILKLKTNGEEFLISASGGNLGTGSMRLAAEVSGEEMEVAFNYRYLMEYLNSVNFEKIEIGLNGVATAGVFKPEGREDYLYLVMPVRG